jgi:hypothetical protein
VTLARQVRSRRLEARRARGGHRGRDGGEVVLRVRGEGHGHGRHGGYGYIDEYPVGKYLRDARVTTLYEASQVQKLIIGSALTGVSAFS